MSQASLCVQGTVRPNKYKYGKVRVWSTQRFIAQGSKENQGEGFMPPKTLNFQRILCMPAKSLQSCLTLCDLTDSSPPGSSVHGISQARTLEWIAMPSPRGSSRPRDQTRVSCVSCIGRQILYHCTTGEHSFLAMPHGMQDISSPIRDWTQAWAVKTLNFNHWKF